jgi:hypothetical protein
MHIQAQPEPENFQRSPDLELAAVRFVFSVPLCLRGEDCSFDVGDVGDHARSRRFFRGKVRVQT